MNHEILCEIARRLLPANGIECRRAHWTSYSVGPAPYCLFIHHDNAGFHDGRHYELQLNASGELLQALRQHPIVLACIHAGHLPFRQAPVYRYAVALRPDATPADVSDLLAAALKNRFYPRA